MCEKIYAYLGVEEAVEYVVNFYDLVPVGFIVPDSSRDLVGYDVLVEGAVGAAEKYGTYLITRVNVKYDLVIPKVDRPGDLRKFGKSQWDAVFYSKSAYINRGIPPEWRRGVKKVMTWWPWVGQDWCVVPRLGSRRLFLGAIDDGGHLVFARGPNVAAFNLYYFLLHALRHLKLLKGGDDGH